MRRMEFLRSRKSAVITLVIILLLCLIAITVARMLNRPESTQVFTTNASPPAAQAAPQPKPVPVTGTYASFSYPGSFHPMAESPTITAPTIVSYNYLKSDILTWHLAVEINKLTTPDLDDDSSYLIRKDNPSEYKPSTVTYGNNTFIVMNDTDAPGFGEAAFILHGDMDATIALTGEDTMGTSGLDTTFQQVLQSWNWQ